MRTFNVYLLINFTEETLESVDDITLFILSKLNNLNFLYEKLGVCCWSNVSLCV